MSYSQGGEETVILDFFKDQTPSHLLDVGAYDGKTFSNSLALIERGWSGVLVEPSPDPFVKLLALHKKRPGVELVQAAITAQVQSTPLTFHDSGGDAVSTLQDHHKDRWEAAGSRFSPFHIFPVALSQLFDAFGLTFAFINIDVESTNWELFQQLQLASLINLRLICVEHDSHAAEMIAMAGEHGFKEIYRNAENLILGRMLK